MITKEDRQRLRDLIDPRIELCFDYLFIISEDRMLATHGGNISLVTFNGDILTTADSIYIPMYPTSYNEESSGEIVAVYDYIDDILVYVENGKQGLIDYNGDIILEAKYSEITFDENQLAEILP